ncbi:FUSC family protein [Photobacterium aquae]|uniref:FUSC family protein n=1 Tax=Photobacterium aquae TaxID=1195763 RepID=UPI00069EAD5D|nr:FUSC family protein [Photobacterium aquae]
MISQRCKLPIKVATALTLAIVSALWLGWDKPYWAAFAVIVMAATETSGHSLKKGRHRILGTLLGVGMAFVLVGSFAQQPLHFLLCYTAFAALCVYQQTNPRNGYAWSIGLMVATLVIVMGKLSGDLTFTIAVLRIQETVLGVFCFTLVFSLMWPASSRIVLFDTLKGYFDTQAQHLDTAIANLESTGQLGEEYSFGNSLKQLTRFEDLLQAAKADSYQISGGEAQWQQLLAQHSQWALLCGHLSEANHMLSKPLDPEQSKAVIQLFNNMKSRALLASSLLANNRDQSQQALPPDNSAGSNPPPVPIALFKMAANSSEQHGALRLLEKVLNDMDSLHHVMLQTLHEAVSGQVQNGDTTTAASLNKPSCNHWSLAIDPERAINALKASIMIWICIALWIYVPMPGGAMIVMLGGILGSVILSLPFANTRSILLYMIGWSSFVLLQYVFVLPHLTEIWQLGGFYFLNAFGIWYLFNQPQQIFHRLLGTQNLVLMSNSAMKLVPSYDIQSALLQLLIISIGMLVIFFVNHGVFSGAPERVFLRQLTYFRRSLQNGLKALLDTSSGSIVTLSVPSPLRAVAMADNASNLINWRVFPDIDKKDADKLISHAYSLCVQYRAFSDSYRQWQQQSYHAGIDRLVRRSIEDMATFLNTTMINESYSDHDFALKQLRNHLQTYLSGFSKQSVLQFAFSNQDADECYLLLTSLQLFVESLQHINLDIQHSNFYNLKLSPFAI